MEFRVLGPVELWAGPDRIDAGTPKQRAVLAVLLLDAGRVVPVDTLVDRVWDTAPPADPRRVLHAYLARIRTALRAAGDPDVTVTWRAGGYQLTADPDRVDAHRFRTLIERAGTAASGSQELLRSALALWHGTALSGVPGMWADRMRGSLELERLDALAELARLELAASAPQRLLPDLRDAAARHPHSEAIAGLLMRSLFQTGRPAEALSLYARTRTRLIEDLGAEPGPELRAAHQAVLRGEFAPVSAGPVPAGPVPAGAVPAGSRAVPAQLPADVPAFTGRQVELAELAALPLGADRPAGDGPLIIALCGTAGVGKTALAVRWARRVADRFPAGQLYVDLRGYDPEQPVPPERALAGFLAALGVAPEHIPMDLDDRAARFRSETAGRRLLVVLDNAASVERIRPLLPGAADAVVLVTSRDSLAGLVALHGAVRIELDRLPAADAEALLGRLVGSRASAEPAALTALAELCVRLPLALRIAGELAVDRAGTPLAELVDELTGERQRLELLDAGGDPRAAVTAAFSWSVGRLDPTTGRLFRFAGLHPGPDLDGYAAAALIGGDLHGSRRALTGLARAHLIETTAPGRYGMHDLLRAYAARLAGEEDPKPDRDAALDRLLAHYLATASAAMDLLSPAQREHRPTVDPATGPVPGFDGPAEALGWLDAERPALLRAAVWAAAHGRPRFAVELSPILFRYLDGRHYSDALTVHRVARDAAAALGDAAGEARAQLGIGAAYWRLSRYDEAADCLTSALRLFAGVGDRIGQARAVTNLSAVEVQRGRYTAAIELQQRGLELFRATANPVGEAHAHAGLAQVQQRLYQWRPARDNYQRALRLFRTAGDAPGEAWTRTNLGLVEAYLDNEVIAADHLERALDYFRSIEQRVGEAWVRYGLGVLDLRCGRPAAATERFAAAVAIFREFGDRDSESAALNGLGEAAFARHRTGEALTRHRAALAIADEISAPDQQARAHAGLARGYLAAADRDHGDEHRRAALALYAVLGMAGPDELEPAG